ncbi:MAG: hypothetical protein AAB955_00825 [Patescibacteria group bacterium]
MKKYLVTGVAGTGKTSVCRQLVAMGHEAHGIEDSENEGLFAMFRKDTGEPYEGYTNTPEMIKNAEWRCDVTKLRALLGAQKTDTAFYCGTASNMDDIIPLFDKMILLTAPAEVVHTRLSDREGKDYMGGTEESRQAVLGWKDWWDDEMRDRGAIEVSADGIVKEVAERVVQAAAL